MGSHHLNFKSFSDTPAVEASGGGKPVGNFPLARQSSIYSLTFDELQNTWSGAAAGKDFGSMNMDELLKNIWTVEETQALTPLAGPSGNLQRQGSITLPRTLSQKTVDEVWRDLIKENGVVGGGKDESGGGGASGMPQRQQTLGEMTLEEFLLKAGVVREDAQQIGRPSNGELFGELMQTNNAGLSLAFQQPSRNNGIFGNQMMERNNTVQSQINFSGARSSQHPQTQQQQLQRQQQQPLFPKQATVAFASPVQAAQLPPSSRARGTMGIADPYLNNNLVQAGGIGMAAGLGARGVMVAGDSPANQMSSDAIGKSSADTSPISPPVPYAFSRGRRCGGSFEKVVERRQRRMIKNRESAARSRARKQAYTLELEAEVAKLKEVNEELQRKQEVLMEVQKNQLLEKMSPQWGAKRQCLRRTLTGP